MSPRTRAFIAIAGTTMFAGMAVACSGGTEDAGPLRPEVVEIRGTAPSTTVKTRPNATGSSLAGPEITLPTNTSLGVDTGPKGGTIAPGVSVTPTTVTGSAPYRVETGKVTLTDTSRGTPARGDNEASDRRVLETTMYVPVGRPKAPLIVFAIGFNASAETYDTFVREIAAGGYMVAVPEFPMATSTLPGKASQADLPNQPADVKFVITQLLEASKRTGAFFNAIDANRIGVVGQSDGGNTVSAIGLNSCCLDSRVKAVVSLAGEKAFMPTTWVNTGTLPYLAIHGTADTITPYARSEELYAAAGSPKFLASIAGADHLGPVTDNSVRPAVVKLTLDFLEFYVNADSNAYDRFVAGAKVPPFSLTGA